MIRTAREVELSASADTVWEIVSNFNAFTRYIALVDDSHIDPAASGTVRTLTLSSGDVLKEKLIRYDYDKKVLQYTIVEGPLPVKDYLSTMTVIPTSDGCRFVWSGEFNAEGMSDAQACEVMEGIYQLGCDGLQKIFS